MFDRDLSLDTVDALLKAHGARLSTLLGKTIDRTWVAWDVARDEWFADEAVILEVDGTALEIVCWRLSDIVLSWNAIDRGEPPHWVAEWGRNSTWNGDVELQGSTLEIFNNLDQNGVAVERFTDDVFRRVPV